jgi:transposase
VIHPPHGVQVFVATKPVDFRKGHDGLAALVQSHLQKKPSDGAVYVFRAKRADRLKMIWWDGTGLVMAYQRLEQNVFKWPATWTIFRTTLNVSALTAYHAVPLL